jgi:hypothetical protein
VFYALVLFSFVGISATSRGSFQIHPEPDVLTLQEREKERSEERKGKGHKKDFIM